MSQHSDEVRKKRLLKGQDWDNHNKTVEKAAQAYQDFTDSDAAAVKQKPKKSRKRWPIIVAIVVALLVIGFAVYWFGFRDASQPEQEAQDTTTQPEASESSISAGEPETYSSSSFFLSFTHLDTWTVDESDPDILTVTSPVTSLRLAGGGADAKGKVVMTIRHKTNPLKEFDAGNATATKASELINYTKPTQAQRASTYLSFVVYAGATAGIDALYITGDYGYQVGQSVPKVDIANVDPIISVNFEQCIDAACTETNPTTTSLEQWADPSFSDPIKALLQSISIN